MRAQVGDRAQRDVRRASDDARRTRTRPSLAARDLDQRPAGRLGHVRVVGLLDDRREHAVDVEQHGERPPRHAAAQQLLERGGVGGHGLTMASDGHRELRSAGRREASTGLVGPRLPQDPRPAGRDGVRRGRDRAAAGRLNARASSRAPAGALPRARRRHRDHARRRDADARPGRAGARRRRHGSVAAQPLVLRRRDYVCVGGEGGYVGATACPTPERPTGRGSPSAAARPRPARRVRRLGLAARNRFSGLTTKKKTTVAVRRKTRTLRSASFRSVNSEPLIVKFRRAEVRFAEQPLRSTASARASTADCTTQGEGRADDDGHGEVDDVAAQDELTEFLQQDGKFASRRVALPD